MRSTIAVISLSVLGVVLAQTGSCPSDDPNPPPCKTDLDCHLNGACTSGTCACDSPWIGPTCGDMDIDNGTAIWGIGYEGSPKTSSWGGGPPVYDPEDKQYHYFVSEMAGNCGQATWSRMSQGAHLTAPAWDGPYKKAGLALPTWAHNLLYTRDPLSNQHMLWTIGEGKNPESCNPFLNCTDGSTPGAKGMKPPADWPAQTCPVTDRGANIHVSDSLDGPWVGTGVITATKPPLSVCNDHNCVGGGGCCAGTSNPAPYIFPNGTVLLVARSKDAYRYPNGTVLSFRNIWLYRAETYNSTYEWIDAGGPNGSVPVGVQGLLTEDPVLWKGRRGFHILFHSSPRLTHAWSEDGLTWCWSKKLVGPLYDGNDGDFERPRVHLDEHGDILGLTVGRMVQGDAASSLLFKPAEH